MSDKSPAVVPQNEGRVLHAFGQQVIILLDGEQTGGKLTAWINVNPPGDGPPPHYHSIEDETFHVLEGRAAFLVNGDWIEVGPGGSAFMPRGSVHTFKNVGDGPLRMFITTTPSGFETFFARCAEEFAKPGGPDMPRVLQISEEHGIHFVQASQSSEVC
jgi:mannose-6-phosphate isomerase-like protein (cupin superfamily)